ncbi:hypothetical protein ACFOTA_08425 [Chitinophaga sp. GCM10012297]|uniref:Uncharacterized protein n=1 Tax=Chitinophaga chungangae TaxID=2821488 RepID=A0ABS3YD43_9BACT|nr:hypothetical protein [Chitinophaga chungangae]MBO9152228.1 hypothetical protein [Chitinophaga chungangae]
MKYFIRVSYFLLPILLLVMHTQASAYYDRLETVKKRTLLILLPDREEAFIEDYQKLVPEAWTLTPVKVISARALPDYSSDTAQKYAYLTVGGERYERVDFSTGQRKQSNTHLYLGLFMEVTKKGQPVRDLFRIELYPDMETLWDMGRDQASANYRNFRLPHIMAYLRWMQKNLEEDKRPKLYDEITDTKMLSQLRKETLFVPDSMIYTRNKFTGKEKLVEKEFFKAYKGKHQYATNAEMIEMLKTRDRSKPFFIFEYVLSSTNKFVTVLELNSGTIAYRRYQAMSYNLKSKDVERLLD